MCVEPLALPSINDHPSPTTTLYLQLSSAFGNSDAPSSVPIICSSAICCGRVRKLFVRMLQKLPVELIQKCVLYVTIFDLDMLVYANKYLFSAIRTKEFGNLYLRMMSKNMHVIVTLKAEISGLDQMVLAHGKYNTLFCIHTTPAGINTIYEIKVSAAGRVKISESTTILRCSLLRNKAHADCQFCKEYGITKYETRVDKGYKVFYQDWKDELKVTTKSGTQITVFIEHQKLDIGWDVVKPRPKWYLECYGLRTPKRLIGLVEGLWSNTPRSLDFNRLQISNNIYNPWA